MKWYVEQPEKIRSLSLPSIGYNWTLELNLNKLKQEIIPITDFYYEVCYIPPTCLKILIV